MSGSFAVTMNNFRSAYGYTKRVAEVLPELVLGNAGETIGETLRTTKGSLFTKAQAGWQALEKAGKGNFFEGLWKNFKSFYPCIKSNILTTASAAEVAGKSKFLGGVKGLFKGLGKKMPFIASLSLVAFELPNIFKATTEKGIFQGGAEVIKAGARLTGASLGAAIGSAVIPIPFVGSMVGWVAGEWLASKIVGKSYSEKVAEKEEQEKEQQQAQEQAETQQQVNNPGQNINPYWLNNSQQNPQQQAAVDYSQVQQQYNPAMQGNTPQFNGLYNPFAAQTNNYANDIMKPQFMFNQVA